MDISIFLAKALGLYCLIVGVGMFIRPDRLKSTATDIMKAPALMFILGILSLIFGVLIIVGHNVWTSDWRIVITIIGWLSVIRGILRIFFPQYGIDWGKKWVKSNTAYNTTVAVVLLIGLFLSYFGFIEY